MSGKAIFVLPTVFRSTVPLEPERHPHKLKSLGEELRECLRELPETCSEKKRTERVRANSLWGWGGGVLGVGLRFGVFQNNPHVRNFSARSLGLEMAAPILWAPGIFGSFCRKPPLPIKFLVFWGGGILFFGEGGGSANLIL